MHVTANLANSVIFQVVLLVGGIILTGWLTYFVKRPKVRVIGTGGSAPLSIRVGNEPRSFRLGPSYLFGRHIHNDVTIGPIIETSPARGLRASLHEKNGGELISHLFWQLSDCSFRTEVTLAAREAASILIFERGSDAHRYYVWRPNLDWTGPAGPPVVEAQYSSTREFVVEVHDMYGRRKLRLPIKMTLGPEGRLYYHCPVAGGTF